MKKPKPISPELTIFMHPGCPHQFLVEGQLYRMIFWKEFLHLFALTRKTSHMLRLKIRWLMEGVCFAICAIWRGALWSRRHGARQRPCCCMLMCKSHTFSDEADSCPASDITVCVSMLCIIANRFWNIKENQNDAPSSNETPTVGRSGQIHQGNV